MEKKRKSMSVDGGVLKIQIVEKETISCNTPQN